MKADKKVVRLENKEQLQQMKADKKAVRLEKKNNDNK